MVAPPYAPQPINLSWGQLIAAHWSVCWPATLAAFLVLALVGLLWEIDDLQGQLDFLSLLAKAIYLVVQAAVLPRLFKKDYRTFFLAPIAAPLLRLVTQRLILAQIFLAILVSILTFFLFTSDSQESLSRLNSLLRIAEVLLIGPAALRFALQAKHAGSAITAFPQPR
jgi:hypothetical protein